MKKHDCFDKDYIDSDSFADVSFDLKKPLDPKPIIHKCKDGRLMCLNYHNPYGKDIPRINDQHLLNIIAYIKRRSKAGVLYLDDIVHGKEAKQLLNYRIYKTEAINRKLIVS
jgi:hypothetical protein